MAKLKQKKHSRANQIPAATVSRGELVVRVGINILAQIFDDDAATNLWDEVNNEMVQQRKVVNKLLFARDVRSTLFFSPAKGDPMLVQILAKVCRYAAEFGSEAIAPR
jgi:uncharacterized membrane protein YcjF (UPF0283 family)